jgi:hypothetical protein
MVEEVMSMMEESISDTKSEENVVLFSNLEKFIYDLQSNLQKSKYRKVIEEIEAKQLLFTSCHNQWKLIELKIKCMLKIIQKKVTKIDNQTNLNQIHSIDTWFLKLNLQIDNWYDYLINVENNNIDNNVKEQYDLIIEYTLEKLYLNAIYNKNDNKLADSIANLGLAEKLIKTYIGEGEDCCYKILNVAQKIFLFISSMLIATKNYDTAKIYHEKVFKMAYKELLLRNDIDLTHGNGINYLNYNKKVQHNLNKTFINLVICFYQRGVCEENLQNMGKTVEAYQQSRWFVMHFLKEEYPELAQFMVDVNKKANSYYILLKNLKFKLCEINMNLSDIGNDKNKEEKKDLLYNRDYFSTERYHKTKKLVEELKIPELEFDSPKTMSENIQQILSTLKLVDNLLSDEFKDLIKNIKKINLAKIDKECFEKIQKKLNELRTDLNYEKNKRKSTIEIKDLQMLVTQHSNNRNNITNLTYKSSMDISINKIPFGNNSKSIKLSEKALTHRDFHKNNNFSSFNVSPLNIKENNDAFKSSKNQQYSLFSKTNTNTKFNSMQNSPQKLNYNNNIENNDNIKEKQRKKLLHMRSKSENQHKYSGAVEKINYNPFISSKSYRKKVDFLNKCHNRELDFQKQLLLLKSSEKLLGGDEKPKEKNIKNVKKEAINFFRRITSAKGLSGIDYKNSNNSINNNKNKMSIISPDRDKFRDIKRKQKLEDTIIKSLDSKKFSELSGLLKKENGFQLRQEFNTKSVENQNKLLSDTKAINKANNEMINKLDKQLDNIHKTEMIILKEYYSSSKPKERSHSKVQKRNFNPSNFKLSSTSTNNNENFIRSVSGKSQSNSYFNKN